MDSFHNENEAHLTVIDDEIDKWYTASWSRPLSESDLSNLVQTVGAQHYFQFNSFSALTLSYLAIFVKEVPFIMLEVSTAVQAIG